MKLLTPSAAICKCAASQKTILPLGASPITTFNYTSFLLKALLGCHHNFSNFIFNNYIQLSSVSINSASHVLSFVPAFGLDDATALGVGEASSLTPKDASEVENIVTKAISYRSYVRVVVDEFYIPDKPAYGKYHFVHDNMIYGYCRECKTCYLTGRRSNNEASWGLPIMGTSACSMSALSLGVFSRLDRKGPKYLQDKLVVLTPSRSPPRLDIPHIKRQIEAYVSSTHDPALYVEMGMTSASVVPAHHRSKKLKFGFDVYEQMINHTLFFAGHNLSLDMRPYRLLWEHKACMVKRVEALAIALPCAQIMKLMPQFVLLEELANRIRYRAMDYEIGDGRPMLVRSLWYRYIHRNGPVWTIVDDLRQLKEKEYMAFETLLKLI